MARQEADREDLMRDATAISPRAEYCISGFDDNLIAGYRSNGSLSLYCGPDPCYHFDSNLRLRRAFIDGHLYRTQGDTLARLTRVRDESHVQLERHDLSPAELSPLLDDIEVTLAKLREQLVADGECLATVPADVDLGPRLIASLSSLAQSPLQLAPMIRGKR